MKHCVTSDVGMTMCRSRVRLAGVCASEQRDAVHCASIRSMARTIHSARITGPVPYIGCDGKHRDIPLGPCIVEQEDGPLVDIVWGVRGQNSTVLPIEAMASATDSGHLVLLD